MLADSSLCGNSDHSSTRNSEAFDTVKYAGGSNPPEKRIGADWVGLRETVTSVKNWGMSLVVGRTKTPNRAPSFRVLVLSL